MSPMDVARAPTDEGRDPARDPREAVEVRCRETGRALYLRLGALLGVGGMATVHAAEDDDGRALAVKRLGREHDGALRQRFFLEKALADRVRHDACVPVHLAGTTTDGDAVLVMDRVDGDTVEAIRRRLGGRLPLVPSLRVAEDVLDFLVACHGAGVLHLDVKTPNLLLDEHLPWGAAGRVRVVDFGVARALDLPDTSDTTLGTPSFMSPEQAGAHGGAVDARADVFSVGAVLFTLLTGQRLHRGRTHDESLFLAATQRAPRAADLAELPPDVAALVDRALAFHPDERFADAATMRAAVRALREREEQILAAAAAHDADTEADDGLVDRASGARSVGSLPSLRAPDARGSLRETPLPHLLTHVLARGLDGRLVVVHGDQREALDFIQGAPIRRGARATDDPLTGVLARVALLPANARWAFFIDDELRGTLGDETPWTRVEPLEAILTSTRRACRDAKFLARVRETLDKLPARPLALHPAAALGRFALAPLERAAIDAALSFGLTYPELKNAAVAPLEVVEPLVYALGTTKHLDVGVVGAHPIGVPRREDLE